MKKLTGIKVLIVISLLFLTSCSSSNDKLENMEKGKFIIGYSQFLKADGKFVVYDSSGNALSEVNVEPTQLRSTAKDNKNYYFVSARSGVRYQVSNSGEVTDLMNPNDSKASGGSYFIHAEDGFVFYDINIGKEEGQNEYVSQLVYWKNTQNEKNHVELKGTIMGAHVIDNKIYALSDTLEKMYISVIDTNTNKKVNEFEIKNQGTFFEATNDKYIFQEYKDKLLLAVRDINKEKPSRIYVIDYKSQKIDREILFDHGFSPYSITVLKDQVYIVGENEEILEFSSDLKLQRKYALQHTNQFNSLNTFGMGDLVVRDQFLYVLYEYNRKTDERGQIITYDIQTGKMIESTVIKDKKKWEFIRFEVIK
ncbi:hypothetical protein [Brevibacillus laterosporus]|uniref:hypothetical protein n=1 Tax=Brevibacillus laterosporus TaxID=1465 RepID=UPI003D25AD69